MAMHEKVIEAASAYEAFKEFGTEVEGFRFGSIQKYRHAAQSILRGEPGLEVEEQVNRIRAAIDVLEEALAYAGARDYDAHQVAKAAATEAYQKALETYSVDAEDEL